jgi:hypothetical protein
MQIHPPDIKVYEKSHTSPITCHFVRAKRTNEDSQTAQNAAFLVGGLPVTPDQCPESSAAVDGEG